MAQRLQQARLAQNDVLQHQSQCIVWMKSGRLGDLAALLTFQNPSKANKVLLPWTPSKSADPFTLHLCSLLHPYRQ